MLADLAARPGRLFALLMLLNAAGLPYAGLAGDARLYAAQALNAHDGRFAGDLFFEYGSQSKYTLFPILFAPACGAFGPEMPFFVGYVLSVTLFLFAAMRLVLRLLGPTPAAVVACLMIACSPVPLAGSLSVNETEFTPRLPAVGFAALALERLLAGQKWQAAALLLPAFALHPLMAAPVAIAWGVWVSRLPLLIVTGLAAAGITGLLTTPEVGVSAFGRFDPEWRGWVLTLHRYLDPSNWYAGTWWRLGQAAAFAIGMAIVWKTDPPRRRMVALAAWLAVVGVLVAAVAAKSEFAVLFQGQAYRWVWPLELLRVPLGVALVYRLWEHGRRPLAAVVAALLAGLPPPPAPAYLPAAAAGLFGVVLWRTRPDRATRAAVLAAAVAVLVNDGIALRTALTNSAGDGFDFAEWLGWWAAVPPPALRLALAVAAAWVFAGGPGWLPAAAAVGVHLAVFNGIQKVDDPDRADARFVQEYLDSRPGPRPTVYWPCERLEAVWFRLNCPSYFDLYPLSGNCFARGTAAEGDRRAKLVAPFEVDRFRRSGNGYWKQELSRGPDNPFGATWDHPPPAAADLARVEADVIVLPAEFPGAKATNGRVYIYEGRRHP